MRRSGPRWLGTGQHRLLRAAALAVVAVAVAGCQAASVGAAARHTAAPTAAGPVPSSPVPRQPSGPVPRIMIVGDSITEGSSGDYTWQYRLYDHLRADGVRPAVVGPYHWVFNN